MNIFELLQKRYPASEYVLMSEVSDDAGYNRSRSADYIAVGLWPSRGMAINGIELKSFRSDWLGELKKHEKAENIFQYCDFFWLLTTDERIAKIEEIPMTWGWLCVKGEKIIVKKDAPKLEPKPLTRGFVVAMLKRAANKDKFVHIDSIKDKINQSTEQAVAQSKINYARLENELMEHRQTLLDFERISGIRISKWELEKVANAVKLIADGGTEELVTRLELLGRQAKQIHSGIEKSLQELNPDKSTPVTPMS